MSTPYRSKGQLLKAAKRAKAQRDYEDRERKAAFLRRLEDHPEANAALILIVRKELAA